MAFETTLERVVSRLTEVSIDSGDATDGSLITIVDTIKNWEVNKWVDAIVEVEVDDVHYYRTVTSNTADTLTITALPAGHPVAAGDHYNIRLSTRIVTISGQAVTISSGNIAVVSGNVAVVSGEVHVMSGHITIDSGAISIVSGNVTIVSGEIIARISGQTVTVSSGAISIVSGNVAVVSGEVHVMSGQLIAKISGETVTVSSGAISVVSGNVAIVSGNVAVVSGEVHVMSGQLIAKISGEVMQIVLPTEFKTGLIRSIISASGGEVLHSGAVKAAQVKSLATNSGVILIGGENDRPWYEDTCSGLGFVLDPGEVKSEDIDDFSRIYVVAQVSGDQVSFAGVN